MFGLPPPGYRTPPIVIVGLVIIWAVIAAMMAILIVRHAR